MSNWVENNPTKSIIIYTILIAGVVWAISVFIIDERRVNLYKAQVEDSKAVTEQYKAKSEVLTIENSRLREEKSIYLKWLENQPDSFPALKIKIKELEKQLLDAKSRVTLYEKQSTTKKPLEVAEQLYSVRSNTLIKGESFVDPYTFAVLGVSDIDINRLAKIALKLPGKETEYIENVRPGSSWEFSTLGKKFIITLSRIDWINDTFKVDLLEKTEKAPTNK